MKRISLFLVVLLVFSLVVMAEGAATILTQYKIDNYVPAGNYSGIVPIGDNSYAVVSDKAAYDGFYVWTIIQNEQTGKIESVSTDSVLRHGNIVQNGHNCDYEGIAYFPQANTLFISDEATQGIYEHNLDGTRTGRSLAIPAEFSLSAIASNYGFEALTYSTYWQRFFTTTENTLKADGAVSSIENPVPARLRIQAFDNDLQPREQFIYETDTPKVTITTNLRNYAFGVPELLVDDANGDMYVLEREFVVNTIAASVVYNKIYKLANGAGGLSAATKELIAEWKTHIDLTNDGKFIANYEGMCWGRILADGRKTILLVNDSQDRYSMGGQHLREYVKVIIFNIIDTNIEQVQNNDIQVINNVATCSYNGRIRVYTPSGILVKTGVQSVCLDDLNRGIYIISNANKTIRFCK